MWNKRERIPLKLCETGPLKNELHGFRLEDNSDSSRMGDQWSRRKGKWKEASTSKEMILCLSTHPIMICAHASIHADSLKIWEQMMHRTTLSLVFQFSQWLAFSFTLLSLLCPCFSPSLQFPPLALSMHLRICRASIICLPIPFSYILHLFIWAHLMQSVPGVGKPQGQLWALMPTGISIKLPKACPW